MGGGGGRPVTPGKILLAGSSTLEKQTCLLFLYLADNSIDAIPGLASAQRTTIRKLDLSWNMIRAIDAASLEGAYMNRGIDLVFS